MYVKSGEAFNPKRTAFYIWSMAVAAYVFEGTLEEGGLSWS